MAIKLKKVSPSSINTFDGCEMKWFLSYVLGYREPSGLAAAKGTCAHYIMECLGKARLLAQEGKKWGQDPIVGRIYAHLTKTNDVGKWIDKTYDHFSKENAHLQWSNSDKRDVERSVDIAIKHDLSPLNHAEIISTEQRFSIPIDEDWAVYCYHDEKTDSLVEGRLEINGVIDLVYKDEEGKINYLDYKFGKSTKNWNTGEENTYASMMRDTQLCMYYWAIRQKYKDEQDINSHIWYVNIKKRFSLFFDEAQIKIALDKVRNTFLKIKEMEKPKRNITWKCRFCAFSKTSFGEWGKPNLEIPYDPTKDRFSPVNGCQTVCDAANYFIDHRGLRTVMENCKYEK